MTERYYNDGTEPTVLPHMQSCSGPCKQGRLPCPAPDACQVPPTEAAVTLAWRAVVLVVLAVLAGLILSYA